MRRSGRIAKEIPILLFGTDLDGTVFSEPTHTVLLSLHGAGIISEHKLSPEQELILRWPERNKEGEIRVVGEIGADSGRFTYGVAFLDSAENFWEAAYPRLSPAEKQFGVLFLSCNACHTVEKIDDASIEADVCATNEGVVRYCPRCGCSTVWKLALPGSPAVTRLQPSAPALAPPPPPGDSAYSSAPPAADPQSSDAYSSMPPEDLVAGASRASMTMSAHSSPLASGQTSHSPSASPPSPQASAVILPSAAAKPSARPADRRKYPRIKVNYMALVRLYEREDIVQCEDVSRGGLRFKSRTKYFQDALIEVAAPYSSGQPAIFVPAQIVFVQELPEQKLFRYGVAFRKSVPSHDPF